MIASAATTGETLPSFADILRQLTPEEARLLELVYRNEKAFGGGLGVERAHAQQECKLSDDAFLVRAQNLDRLGLLIKLSSMGMDQVRGKGWGAAYHIGLTALGAAFVRACRGPAQLAVEGGVQ